MKKLLCLIAILSIAVGAAFAQQTSITSTTINDLGGHPLTGQLCLTNSVIFSAPGGTIIYPSTTCTAITNGALATTEVWDTSLTTPANICYSAQVVSSTNAGIAKYPCIQPSGATWSLSNYIASQPSYIPTQNPINATMIQGTPVASTTPSAGQVLTFNGQSYVPAAGGGGGGGDNRASVIQTTGKTATLTPSGTTQVFTATGAGTITFIHLTMQDQGSASDAANLIQNSRLIVDCDGDMETAPLGLFFLTQDSPEQFSTDQIAVPLSSEGTTGFKGYWSVDRRVWIDFTTGCTLGIQNASATDTADIYVDTTYLPGTDPSPGPRAHWHASYVYFPSLSSNTGAFDAPQAYILPPTTFTGGGQLESVTQFVSEPGAYNGYLEGTPVAACDGAVCGIGNGGEDFFGCGYYCGLGTVSEYTDKWGFFIGTGLQANGGSDALGYRFFTNNAADRATFANTLSVSIANGMNGVSSAPIPFAGLVTYWTADPISQSNATYVSSCSNYGGSNPQTCTLVPNAGDFIFAFCATGGTPTSITATDSFGDTFAKMNMVTAGNTVQGNYAFSVHGGTTSVRCTGSSTFGFQAIQVLDYRPGTITTLAAQATSSISGGSTFTSNPISTTGKALVIVCANPPGLGWNYTAFSIGTLPTYLREISGSAPCMDATADTSQTNITGTLTTNGGSGNWVGTIAAFQ